VCRLRERIGGRQASACLPCNQGCVSEITEMRLTGSNLAKAPSMHLIYQLLVCMQPIQLARVEGLRTWDGQVRLVLLVASTLELVGASLIYRWPPYYPGQAATRQTDKKRTWRRLSWPSMSASNQLAAAWQVQYIRIVNTTVVSRCVIALSTVPCKL